MAALLLASGGNASAPEVLLLRPGNAAEIGQGESVDLFQGNPADRWIAGIRTPTLTVLLAPAERANGTAVIICPGGGYKRELYDREGLDVARWLNQIGVAGIVLKYRLPTGKYASGEDALAGARNLGGLAVCALTADSAWWGRLLAEPKLKVFAALPCLAAWGPLSALAVAQAKVEPTGADNTFWVTDAPQGSAAIEDALSRDGVAATLLAEAGGLKLFMLSGFYQPDDPRLARGPGRLSGVIGAAPAPLDV